MKWCPKCEDGVSKVFDNLLCDKHQKEYEEWLNDDSYLPASCACGLDEWIEVCLQMTSPESLPEMEAYKCKQCGAVQLERSARTGMIRIKVKEDIRK